MFYNKEYNITLSKQLIEAGAAIGRLARTNLIQGEVQQKAFINGLRRIKDMSAADFDKWRSMTPDQVKAMKDAKDQKDKEAGMTLHLLYKSMLFMSDIKYGTDLSNSFAEMNRKRQKDFHADNNSMFSNDVQTISAVVNAVGQQVDLGYLDAYNSVDARSARKLRISDLIYQVRFMELAKGSEPVLSGGFDEQTDDITGRYFGAAVSIDDRDSQFMPVCANALLAQFRIESERTLSHVAYKEIFRYRTAQVEKNVIEKLAATANDDAMTAHWRTILNGRHTLNEGVADMFDAANKVSAGNKKTQNTTEINKNIPISTPIAVYYNHRHSDFFTDIQSNQSNQNLPQTGLHYNYLFIPTAKAPLSGAWTMVDEQALDDFGTRGTVKEKGTKNHTGCKAIIPSLRNIAATFEGLNFEQDRRSTSRATIISARQMANFVVDDTQVTWVKLK